MGYLIHFWNFLCPSEEDCNPQSLWITLYLRHDDSWRRPSFFDKRCAEDWLCGISVWQLRWKKGSRLVVKFMLIWQVGILMNPLFRTFQLLIELWGKFAWKTSVLKMMNIQWMYLPAHWKGDSGLEERLVHFRTPLGYFSIPMTPSHYSDTLGQGIQNTKHSAPSSLGSSTIILPKSQMCVTITEIV